LRSEYDPARSMTGKAAVTDDQIITLDLFLPVQVYQQRPDLRDELARRGMHAFTEHVQREKLVLLDSPFGRWAETDGLWRHRVEAVVVDR